MKKIFLLIQLVALTVGLKAHAISGGPFDNDSSSILLERDGYYQATFSFPNGSGFAVFTPDSQYNSAALTLLGVTTSGGGTSSNASQSNGAFGRSSLYTANTGTLHSANRSVFYYKGVTYIGSCFGTSDIEARKIIVDCNASSDESTTTASLQSGLFTSTLVTSTTAITTSNTGFIINLGADCDITDTAPTLKFSGSGEMTVIAPNATTTVSQLAYSGYSQLITAIVNAVNNNTTTVTAAQAAITSTLTSLQPYLANASLDATYNSMIKETVRVSGVRRYY